MWPAIERFTKGRSQIGDTLDKHKMESRMLGNGHVRFGGGQGYPIITMGSPALPYFISPDGARLWFIEDGEGGAITALLPEEY